MAISLHEALSRIRSIADYPKPGILFQDITPLLSDADAFATVISHMSKLDLDSELAIGIEARGFILASSVATHRKIGFVPLRKKGKLPAPTFSKSYGLEYGDDEIEIHRDALQEGTKVVLIDDVLATGGTLEAGIDLVQQAGGILTSTIVLMEISDLNGRLRIQSRYPDLPIHALVTI
jgi:adenine phosphoribosyltransferase